MRIDPVSRRNYVPPKDIEANSSASVQNAPAQDAAAAANVGASVPPVPPNGTPVTRSNCLPPDSALPPSIVLQLKQIDPYTGLAIRNAANGGSNVTWTPENRETINTIIGQALKDNGGDVSKAFAGLRDKRRQPENYYDTNMAIATYYLRARYDTQQYGPRAVQQMNNAYMAFKRATGVPTESHRQVSPPSKLERRYMNRGVADEKAIMPWSKQKELNRNVIVVGGIPITIGGVKTGADQVKRELMQVKRGVQASIQQVKKAVGAGIDQAKKGMEAGIDQAKKSVEVGIDHVKKGADAGMDQVKKGVDKLLHLLRGNSE